MSNVSLLICLVATLVAISIAAKSETCEITGTVPNPSPKPDSVGPDTYTVSFSTNVLIDNKPAPPIVLSVNRTWAPLGADRFFSLVRDGFYNQAAFFRVVPDFVLQFGISADPAETKKWKSPIPDDPVLVSNTNWTVTFATAGANTRTSQIFINYVDNSRLDASGFSPFAKVVSGFETALAVVNPTPGNSDGVNQGMYTAKGNDWILSKYPEISLIKCTDLTL
jgi:peptidyl-prolyl cis-trans isomerase A (cyclophilin A)